jgi:hypothetical protein
VLVNVNEYVCQTTTGGLLENMKTAWEMNDWKRVFPRTRSLWAGPLVRAPESERVALGDGSVIQISDDFGNTWPSDPAHKIILPDGEEIPFPWPLLMKLASF